MANEKAFQEGVDYVKYLYGIESLHNEQYDALRAFCLGKENVFVSAGTGFGKSLIFQAVPIIFDHLMNQAIGTSTILVISPLISLMDDQVRQCDERGISAVALHSNEELSDKIRHIEDTVYSIVYTSPEAALSKQSLRKLFETSAFRSQCIGLAVDEAHLIAQWYVYDNSIHTRTMRYPQSVHELIFE